MSDSIKILKDFTERLKKSMSPEVLHSMVKRHRMQETAPEFVVTKDITSVRELGSRSVGGNFERVIIPTEVATPEVLLTKSESHTDCQSCGYMYKSTMNVCPRCAPKSDSREALPFYKR